MVALHLATRVFWREIILVTSSLELNKEQERAREKRRRNLKHLSQEILVKIKE